MSSKIIRLVLLLYLCIGAIQAQDTLSPEIYLNLVQKNHPVIKQADILLLKAQAQLTSVRGAFDPEAYAYIDQKQFSEKNYFNLLDAGISWRTPYALQLKGSYQQAQGYYVNPQNTTPDQGLYQLGASLPLGYGLLMDEQRLALKQAKLFKQASITEQVVLCNQLCYKALCAYFDWVMDAGLLKISQEALGLSEQRLKLTITSYQQGDKPAIDTLEAYIQFQTRLQSLQQISTDFLNASIELSNYLWDEQQNPIQVSTKFIAPNSKVLEQQKAMDSLFLSQTLAYQTQPELLLYQIKGKSIQLEKRLKLEKLKPKVNIQYNFLSSTWNEYDWAAFAKNNYKWGAQLSLPLLLRNGMGEVKLANLKMQEWQLEVQNKQQAIRSKIGQYSNEYENLKNQVVQQRDLMVYTARLLSAEEQNFASGESSVFMINTRENNYLKAQEKYLELLFKLQKNATSFKAYMGLLP